MSYDIDKKAYSYVGAQTKEFALRSIASSRDELYLFETYISEGDGKIFEMITQYEVLDTIITNEDLSPDSPGLQGFITKEGKIYLLLVSGGVYCFDPSGERELTEVLDLRKD